MRLMSIVTASVVLGATTGLSSMRASAQNYAAGSSMPTGTFTWTYESGSNRKSSLAYPNGATASWSYNNRGELTSVQNRHVDGTAISTYDYTYDAVGRRISKNDERYGYNARSELTQATSISNPNFHAAYQFDDIGNRETSAEFGIRSGEYTYTANELNQYASIVDENAVDSAGPSDATFTPTYDADGNQTLVKTKTGIWQVTYNAENRPVKWTCGTTNLVMAFDRMGRRVLSEVQVNDAPIKTETYVYDGYTCILRQTTLHTNATPTVVRDTFVWDPTEPVATRPLVWNRVEEKGSSRETHPTVFYFHDGNKNVSDVVSATDETKAHYTYAPFGDCTATGTLAESNPWRFSSEYADDEIGCIYYNYRHYEPTMGRWMSRDPIGEELTGGKLYVFLTNRYGIDILGLEDEEKTVSGIIKFNGRYVEAYSYSAISGGLMERRKKKIWFEDKYKYNVTYKTSCDQRNHAYLWVVNADGDYIDTLDDLNLGVQSSFVSIGYEREYQIQSFMRSPQGNSDATCVTVCVDLVVYEIKKVNLGIGGNITKNISAGGSTPPLLSKKEIARKTINLSHCCCPTKKDLSGNVKDK